MTDRRSDIWEDVQSDFITYGSVAVTRLSNEWGAISANHLTQDEKDNLLAILESDTDED
jgi:hypothetical protein